MSVDFSGCTLSSSEQQVLVIISLRVPTTSITSINILDLEQQVHYYCVCIYNSSSEQLFEKYMYV